MERWTRLVTVLLGLALGTGVTPETARSQDYVDLELVLAVDVSLSMDAEEQRLQRDGYAAAFRDPKIFEAIKRGPNARIAVTYVEWAGSTIQSVVIPWRIIASAKDANAFADELAAKPIQRALMTSVSEAVLMSSKLFASSGVRGLRRVIDVSGDGPNNSGGPIEAARDRVVASGIVINGLAIQIGVGGGAYSYFDLPDLDRYYKDCVIGGPGSFVLSIKNKREFAVAIRQKLLLEIAGRMPPQELRPQRAQWKAPGATKGAGKYDCLVGEKLWQRYQLDRED